MVDRDEIVSSFSSPIARKFVGMLLNWLWQAPDEFLEANTQSALYADLRASGAIPTMYTRKDGTTGIKRKLQ